MKIVQASISENNTITGNSGDQTGKEVHVGAWYNYPWDIALRYRDTEIAKKAAAVAVKLANSNLVGYDQYQRNTLYDALRRNSWNVDRYIKSGEKTETDCSAFVYAVYCCFIPAMRSNNNAPVTSTMWTLYKAWGFDVKTPTVGTLKNGDIVLNEMCHTAIVIDDQPVTTVSPTVTKTVDDAITTIARDVIAGKWGNGDDRKNNIYNAVQKRVNELLK